MDELTASVPGWNLEFKQLRPGALSANLTFIALGSVLVSHGSWDQPLLQHVAGPRGCLSVNRPGRGSAPVKLHGRVLEDDECFIGGPVSEAEVVSGESQFPMALSLRLDALQEPWLNESEFLSMRGTHVRRAGLPWIAAYLDGMAWIVDAVEKYPDSIARSDVRASLADQLLARVDALGAGDFPLSQDRATRIRRRVGVERARDYIRRNLAEPIRLSHLSRCARMASRSIEYGFMEEIGMPPMVYVRMSRLHRARRVLLSASVRDRTISQVAMDCGFWHLSQFAVDYKALFGESPSITFRRAKAQRPANERRREMATA